MITLTIRQHNKKPQPIESVQVFVSVRTGERNRPQAQEAGGEWREVADILGSMAFLNGISWEVDYSRATAEERASWLFEDVLARAQSAELDGQPIFLNGKQLTLKAFSVAFTVAIFEAQGGIEMADGPDGLRVKTGIRSE